MPEPISDWILEGYTERIYQKTSSLFEYCLTAAAIIANRSEFRTPLHKIGHELGKLYQLSNDFHDMQPHNIRKRHGSNHAWRITYSFPLGVYIERNGIAKVQSELRRKILPFAQWMDFLDKIWTDEVRNIASRRLVEAKDDALRSIAESNLPISVQNDLTALVKLIVQENFWYHPYDAA